MSGSSDRFQTSPPRIRNCPRRNIWIAPTTSPIPTTIGNSEGPFGFAINVLRLKPESMHGSGLLLLVVVRAREKRQRAAGRRRKQSRLHVRQQLLARVGDIEVPH